MKTVNLEEILIKQFDRFGNFDSKEDIITGLKEDAESSIEIIINAIREACNQTLDLAAEEVEQYEIQTIINLKQQII